MKLSHCAVYVNDLERMREFYEIYFGAESNNRYHNPRTGLSTYFLTFDGGARLELMTRPELTSANEVEPRTGYTHIAFSLGDRDAVDRLTSRLRDDGYTIVGDPRVTGDGYYESSVRDPENNLVELTE